MGARLKIHHQELIKPNRPYVIMANHCSYLDIPALFIAFPGYTYFIAKKELRRMPFLGWFMILAGMIFIDRKNTLAAKESLAEAAKLIQNGKNVIIFPEGTASKNGKMGEFKKGGFHLAADANAYIAPIRIQGTYQIWPSASKLNMRRGTIDVYFGSPLSAEDYLSQDLESRIARVKTLIENL